MKPYAMYNMALFSYFTCFVMCIYSSEGMSRCLYFLTLLNFPRIFINQGLYDPADMDDMDPILLGLSEIRPFLGV